MLIALHKPFGVISQFTPDGSANGTLADFGLPGSVYPLGRLDADSEGLLLLSDVGRHNKRLLDPIERHPRVYWVQVERIPTAEAMGQLLAGPTIQGYKTLPCKAKVLEPQPVVAERTPAIRFRKNVATCWICMELVEGKNRQVRRMTAAVGFPTLRLIRVQIGKFHLGDLARGSWRILNAEEERMIFERGRPARR